MKEKLLSIIFVVSGIYYAFFSLWAIVAVDSFSRFTMYRGDFFLKHIAAILF